MSTLMYDALINAGVKEEDARAAAIEAGRNDLRYIAFEYAIKELRTEMHSELRRLQNQMIGLMLSCSALIIGFMSLGFILFN